MKKTFRKALACLLAVLMVAFSVPFSALAYSTTVGEANYKWWDDANLPTETPEYEPVNATWAFNRNIAKALLTNTSNAPKRWNARPVVGATVSYLGTADDSLEDLWARYEGYYGKAGFADAEAAGYIMNPTEIKAGQRIAVTYEFGGVDLMNNGQIMSNYDPSALAPAGYQDEYFLEDEWDAWDVDFTADYGKVAIENVAFAPVATMDDTQANVGFVAKVATSTATSSVFIGGYNDIDAKYGIPCATFFFEALQDCDLTEAITFVDGQGGTRIAWGNMDAGFKDDLYLMTMSETPYTAVLFAPAIWTNASSAPAPETHEHDYKSEVTTPATCSKEGVMTYTCQSTTGTCDRPSYTEAIAIDPTAHTAAAERANVKAATCETDGYTGDKVCKDCGTTLEEGTVITKFGHNYTSVDTTPATCTSEGVRTWTCQNPEATCELHSYTEPIAKLDHVAAAERANVKAATCTEAGYSGDVVCKNCGDVMTAGQATDPLDHDFSVVVSSTAADCQTKGTTTYKCSRCTETKTVDGGYGPHGEGVEDEGVVTTEPTCTTLGVKTFTTKCSVCGEVLSRRTEDIAMTEHVAGEPEVTRVEATVDADGSVTTIVKCVNCGTELSKDVEVLPMLKSYTVTVDAADMGTVTLAGTDVTNGGSAKFVPGSKVTLTAEAFDGAKFIGWTANGKTTVSTDAEFTTTVLANVTYTPVFEVATESVFTVTFVDAYGNVVAVCTSDKGIDVPAAPARAGYVAATDNGWSMTNDEIAALTASATVTAQYVKAEEATYTVKAAGCDITANGETIADELSVPFDTKVTVTNTSATAWIVKDAKTGEEVKVAYGDSYTFFVTADIELTYDTEAVVATPQVANVGVEAVGTAPRIQAMFKATRTMADGCQYIDSGFVYGKGDLGAITLDDVDGKAVKAVYNKTASEQFSLTYGLSAQQGTITAVAFLAYVDADGVNQVAYAAPMTFTY